MNQQQEPQSFLERFKLRGTGGIIALVAVAVLAFSMGSLLTGGPSGPADSQQDAETAAAKEEPTIWTCSMHPQIRLNKPGKCPICFMDLIPLTSGADDELGPRQLRLSETAMQLAQIETTPAKRAFASTSVRMSGKIAYDETRLAYITAWVPGRLDRLYADYTGVRVAKGDHMVSMYSPELLAAQQELLQARKAISALDRSRSTVLKSTAQATYDAAREKLRLYGLSEEQLDEIEAGGKVSDHLNINAPVGGIVVKKDAQEGMYVKTGTRIYTIADLTKLWAVFDAYESDLPWLRYGQEVQFTSPSFPGQTFTAIISFIDPVVDPATRTVQVRAIVDNKDSRLKPDMFVRGMVQSKLNEEGDVIDKSLAGKWISPMHPEIVSDHSGQCPICGMDLVPAKSLGYATRAATSKEAPLLIPASAPLITGKRAIVYVQLPSDDGPLFEGRVVELGPRAGDFYVVKSGIKEGEMVVTNGAFKIDSELQLHAKESMMSPEGGTAPTEHQHGQPAQEAPKPAPTTKKPAEQPVAESDAAMKSLTPIYDAYFGVQMALADDAADSARAAAGCVVDAVKAVDMEAFSPSGHGRWMALAKDIGEHAKQAQDAGDLKALRGAFNELSKSMIDLHDAFGHAEARDYFLTFCPMANQGKGAYWLQTVDTVYNSFYGPAMLRCGTIKSTLAAKSEAD